MIKIRRNDIVQSIKGRDKGKKGKVLKLFFAEKRALVEGINMVKKHKRKTQTDQQGGVVSIELPISIANIKLFCKQCNRPVRVGFTVLTDGTKTRTCKICKEVI